MSETNNGQPFRGAMPSWDWSYTVLQYLRKWPIPTVIIVDMCTVVAQPPPSGPKQIYMQPVQWDAWLYIDQLNVPNYISFTFSGHIWSTTALHSPDS